jgi:hypothetical protein
VEERIDSRGNEYQTVQCFAPIDILAIGRGRAHRSLPTECSLSARALLGRLTLGI